MPHLNQEQISAWLADLQTPEQTQHVEQCPACRAEIARREETLALFRDSVHAISDRRPVRAITWSTPRRWHQPMLRWAAGAALALLMLGLPVMYWNKQTQLRDAERTRQDIALLDSVSRELDRSVPQPLEPLDKLVAWSPTGTSATESESQQ
jgi:predicted anti-sigma-YlaC factor YlaD